jgi:ribosomal protein S18 acetylase RimI-like enzyme
MDPHQSLAMNEHDSLLRSATTDDVSAIRTLTRAAYAKWVPRIGREPLPMTADYDLALREHRFDLLERHGELAALIETIARPDHLWVENLAVSPAFQRQGLGRRLLVHAESLAHSLDHGTIRLVTNRQFTGNVDLYQRAGFSIEREQPFKGGISVFLRKDL